MFQFKLMAWPMKPPRASRCLICAWAGSAAKELALYSLAAAAAAAID